jgi:hypothetical protein
MCIVEMMMMIIIITMMTMMMMRIGVDERSLFAVRFLMGLLYHPLMIRAKINE